MQAMARFQRECTAFFQSISTDGQSPLVFGEGLEKNPVLMLIGEAPGEQEALQLKPFVGRAGKNLQAFLDTLNLKRSDIYITNVVKLRPTKQSPSGGTVNRPPTREEKALFTPWLMREIAIVKPAALVTLGNVALRVFTPDPIGQAHGAWRRGVVAPSEGAAFTLPLFPLYHPASIIYNRALEPVYQADLKTLKTSLHVKSNIEGDS